MIAPLFTIVNYGIKKIHHLKQFVFENFEYLEKNLWKSGLFVHRFSTLSLPIISHYVDLLQITINIEGLSDFFTCYDSIVTKCG
jgi:hypothetical protein